jgi:hypothetical protein
VQELAAIETVGIGLLTYIDSYELMLSTTCFEPQGEERVVCSEGYVEFRLY